MPAVRFIFIIYLTIVNLQGFAATPKWPLEAYTKNECSEITTFVLENPKDPIALADFQSMILELSLHPTKATSRFYIQTIDAVTKFCLRNPCEAMSSIVASGYSNFISKSSQHEATRQFIYRDLIQFVNRQSSNLNNQMVSDIVTAALSVTKKGDITFQKLVMQITYLPEETVTAKKIEQEMNREGFYVKYVGRSDNSMNGYSKNAFNILLLDFQKFNNFIKELENFLTTPQASHNITTRRDFTAKIVEFTTINNPDLQERGLQKIIEILNDQLRLKHPPIITKEVIRAFSKYKKTQGHPLYAQAIQLLENSEKFPNANYDLEARNEKLNYIRNYLKTLNTPAPQSNLLAVLTRFYSRIKSTNSIFDILASRPESIQETYIIEEILTSSSQYNFEAFEIIDQIFLTLATKNPKIFESNPRLKDTFELYVKSLINRDENLPRYIFQNAWTISLLIDNQNCKQLLNSKPEAIQNE